MAQKFQWTQMTVGTCYYPEHWPEELWQSDIDRMLQNGVTVVRIAEFAWSKFERREGEFSFDFFDRFLDLCEAKGMQVIFCTPTATPPAWLTEKYPEVLNCDINGVPYRHGLRRQYNYNSPVYLEKSAIITEKIGEHYGKRPCIVGWQLDNEINCETCDFYSEADHAAFRLWLKEKYGDLDKLNEAWGTVFWNQTYIDWEEIHLPRRTVNNAQNPHMLLDYSRFVSCSAIRFCRLQAQILRRYIRPGVYITTNGQFGNLDNHAFMDQCYDVFTYDSYPSFAYGRSVKWDDGKLNDRRWSRNLTETRSICPHFGIMEQQSGANGWYNSMEGPAPRPGQLTLWAMQSVAHGADYVSFFRWRTCSFGTEIYWHGILDYDNRDNRRLREVKSFHDKLMKLQRVCGAEFAASFALVKDYDNVFDAMHDRWHQMVHWQSEEAVFEAAQKGHMPLDMLYLRENTTLADLRKYPVLVYPHATIMTQERADLLTAYVKAGGTLIIGCRTGYKDAQGHCVMRPQPGLMADLAGTYVEEFTCASPAEEPAWADWDGARLDTLLFNDVLEEPFAPNAKVLARYASGYYAGKPALVENRVGEGRVLFLGSAFAAESAAMVLRHAGVKPVWEGKIDVPAEVETVLRRDAEGGEYLFLLNYKAREMEVAFHQACESLFTGETLCGSVKLPAFGVEVVKIK